MLKKILLGALALIVLVIGGAIGYVSLALPNVGDAPDITVEATPERIARGEYIANNVALCMDCHSTRDWTVYSAPPVPGTEGIGGEKFDRTMGFPGDFYSRNITPFRLKDWTDGEIFRAITTGVSRDGSSLFPIMPYQNYRLLDEEDLYSVIAYLRSLEPIESENIPSKADFPLSVILNTIPEPAALNSIPHQNDKIKKGEYVATMGACKECHTVADAQGNILPDMMFAGNRTFEMPWGVVRSANLTPHETGLGNWTEEMFINRFKLHTDSSYVAPTVQEGDYQTIMPWLMYARMTEEDLSAIFAYLQSLEPIDNTVVKWTPM